MDHLEAELEAAVAQWDSRGWPRPSIMIVAGSGLSTDLGKTLLEPTSWSEVIPFPIAGIEGHPLTFELLEPIPGRVVLSSRGRLHCYQGYTAAQAVFTIRLAALLGAEALLMTNSAGGLLSRHVPGDLILVADHLNLTGLTPLWGRFPESWGPQFPDMMQAYDPAMRAVLRDSAEQLDIELAEGVYIGLGGPSYETPAEVRMLRSLGGDAVGMSTVNEVIAGHHMGLRCGCISVISNPAAGVTDEVLDHADVLARGKQSATKVRKLFEHALMRDGFLTS